MSVLDASTAFFTTRNTSLPEVPEKTTGRMANALSMFPSACACRKDRRYTTPADKDREHIVPRRSGNGREIAERPVPIIGGGERCSAQRRTYSIASETQILKVEAFYRLGKLDGDRIERRISRTDLSDAQRGSGGVDRQFADGRIVGGLSRRIGRACQNVVSSRGKRLLNSALRQRPDAVVVRRRVIIARDADRYGDGRVADRAAQSWSRITGDKRINANRERGGREAPPKAKPPPAVSPIR